MDSSTRPRPGARRRAGLATLGCLGLVLGGCPRATPTAAGLVAGFEAAEADIAEGPPSDSAAARCHAEGRGAALGSERASSSIAVGDGVAFDSGYALGLTHGSGQGLVGAVAWVSADVAVATIADLGPTLAEAPPPRIVRRAGGLVAAYFPRGPGVDPKAPRRLALVAIERSVAGGARALATASQQADESLAFDLALSPQAGVVVWDEVVPPRAPAILRSREVGGRGVIRASVIDRDWRVAAAYDLSPADSDAESPRILPVASGFVAFWIASASDTESAAPRDADSDIRSVGGPEATGEVRTSGWVEMLALDGRAAPRGPVRKLTSDRGHISSYDVLRLDGDSAILVVARDDGELTDGTGGTLLIVRTSEAGPEAPLVLSSGGLGRGAPALVDARPPWVTWVGDHEELRMLPLALTGRPAGAPSAEDGLGEARPLLGIASSTGNAHPATSTRFLTVVPAEKNESPPTVAVAVCEAP